MEFSFLTRILGDHWTYIIQHGVYICILISYSGAICYITDIRILLLGTIEEWKHHHIIIINKWFTISRFLIGANDRNFTIFLILLIIDLSNDCLVSMNHLWIHISILYQTSDLSSSSIID